LKWRYLTDEETVEFLKKHIEGKIVKKVSLDTTGCCDFLVLEFDNGIKVKATDGEYGDLRCIDIHSKGKKIVMLLDDKEHPIRLSTYEEVHNNPKIHYLRF